MCRDQVFLAEVAQDSRDLVLRPLIDDQTGGQSLAAVHRMSSGASSW
jgi:hypothetical protein